jgi:hypothetical protein
VKDVVGGVEQLGFLIRRNLTPIQGRVHRSLIEPELQAVRAKSMPAVGRYASTTLMCWIRLLDMDSILNAAVAVACITQVEAASDRVERELNAAFEAVNLPNLAKMPVKYKPSVVHDRSNNAVWIRIPKGSPVRALCVMSCSWQCLMQRILAAAQGMSAFSY